MHSDCNLNCTKATGLSSDISTCLLLFGSPKLEQLALSVAFLAMETMPGFHQSVAYTGFAYGYRMMLLQMIEIAALELVQMQQLRTSTLDTFP